jgi:hypothetical protein
MSQHLALTNEFEMALQVIEPSLSIPYWDYTQVLIGINYMCVYNQGIQFRFFEWIFFSAIVF